MHVLQTSEIWEWYREHGLQEKIDDHGLHRDTPALLPQMKFSRGIEFNTRGNSPHQDQVARSLVKSLGKWNACLVVCSEWGIWPDNEDWPRFYAWRAGHDVKRSLEDASGHLFQSDDRLDLEQLLTHVFEFGWGCVLICLSQDSTIASHATVSHDGWLSLNSVSEVDLDRAVS